ASGYTAVLAGASGGGGGAVVGGVSGAGEPGADALGGVVDGVVGQQAGIGPHEPAALVRLGVAGFALPDAGGEEHADAGQVGALAVVDDRGQGQGVGVDGDADLLPRLAGRAVVERLALLQVPGGQVQHAVAVPGALPLQQQDPAVPLQDHVDVDNASVTLRHDSSPGTADRTAPRRGDPRASRRPHPTPSTGSGGFFSGPPVAHQTPACR